MLEAGEAQQPPSSVLSLQVSRGQGSGYQSQPTERHSNNTTQGNLKEMEQTLMFNAYK